jgi:hypothetical protein
MPMDRVNFSEWGGCRDAYSHKCYYQTMHLDPTIRPLQNQGDAPTRKQLITLCKVMCRARSVNMFHGDVPRGTG